ncbi:hypothetical protein J6P92_09900 [bacterium]|nr:hypothetical protein [bacterium]
MNKLKNIILVLLISSGLSVFAVTQIPSPVNTNVNLEKSLPKTVTSDTVNDAVTVNPLQLVAKPSAYLNKNVKITAKFDKFSTLGLDYKPAMRSSENYISFLIQRPDITDHNIPLSELKIFITRTEAEKYIELNSGDIIEFSGKVFSTALGDPWMDAQKFTVISSKPKEENK